MNKCPQVISGVLSLVVLVYGQGLLRGYNGLGVDAAALSLKRPNISPILIVTAFSNANDVDPNGDELKEVTLERGQSLIYSCSSFEMAKKGEVTLFPSMPVVDTLTDDRALPIKERVNNKLPHKMVYRSDAMLVNRRHDTIFGDNLLIQYPKDAVIMTKDPDNFSLNFACRFRPKNANGTEVYRWLKVAFKGVYPMAYGCETGFNQLFKNSIPLTALNYVKVRTRMECYVDPKPGMIIGIYCQPGETLYPPNCLSKLVSQLDLSVVKFDEKYADPTFEFDNKSDRFTLFRVPKEGIQDNVQFGCACKRHSTFVKKMLVVSNKKREEINIFRMVKEGIISKKTGLLKYPQMMQPGKSLKIVVHSAREIVLKDGTPVLVALLPEHVQTHAIIKAYPNHEEVETPLSELIGSRGFSVKKNNLGEKVEYTFHGDEDAIFILKQVMSSATYVWKLWVKEGTELILSGVIDIDIGFIPTDPYTYGCGVDSRDLFHTDAIRVDDTDLGSDHKITTCMVNAHAVSPIGFYCPKGYTLEPPDCFTHMIMQSTGKVVPISAFLPHARAIPGNNIRILDTNVSKSKDRLAIHSDEILICRCIDPQGKERANIHMQLLKYASAPVDVNTDSDDDT